MRIFGYAKAAYAELGRKNLLEQVERSMRARRVRSAGRRDEEAMKILHAQPKWGQEVELLNYAANALKEFNASEKAQATAHLARQIQARNKEKRQLTERQIAQQQVETFLFCAKVLAKAKRGEAAKSLEHAADAMRLRLSGTRNEEAQHVMSTAPSRKANATHLAMAAEILKDQGDKEHAQFVAKMARAFEREEEEPSC